MDTQRPAATTIKVEGWELFTHRQSVAGPQCEQGGDQTYIMSIEHPSTHSATVKPEGEGWQTNADQPKVVQVKTRRTNGPWAMTVF